MPKNAELEEAYAILAGIPDANFNLTTVIKGTTLGPNGGVTCGTIACGIGFLMLHPRYHARGLKAVLLHPGTDQIELRTPRDKDARWDIAASRMLNLTQGVANQLFRPKVSGSDYDPPNARSMTDKEVLLARIKNYLGE